MLTALLLTLIIEKPLVYYSALTFVEQLEKDALNETSPP
jgi:hypothetical protein